MELYTDTLYVGKMGKKYKNKDNKVLFTLTNEYIVFEKKENISLDVLTNRMYYPKDNIYYSLDNDACIIDYKPLSLFLPDKNINVVNDYDIFEVINRVNNYDIYDTVEKEDFSNISIFKNEAHSDDSNITRL